MAVSALTVVLDAAGYSPKAGDVSLARGGRDADLSGPPSQKERARGRKSGIIVIAARGREAHAPRHE
jgi:hypothetical protein